MADLVTLITPTGDRPFCFALCEKFMERQTFTGEVQWIVVDDGRVPTPIAPGSRVCTVLRRTPQGNRPKDLLPANLRAAWFGGFVKGDIVLPIEDDDWYPPTYVKDMKKLLAGHDMAGESPYRIYHVPAGRWCIRDFVHQSSLSRTAIRTDALAKAPLHVWEADTHYFDSMLWKCGDIRDKRLIQLPDGRACVGMKGMPGRKGLSPAHDSNEEDYADDRDGAVLRRWVGDDETIYASLKMQGDSR